MKKMFLFFCLLIVTNSICCQSVLYGERTKNNSTPALYFDREGMIYPDYEISDSSLMKSGASLSKWYQNNPDEFISICRQYGLQADHAGTAGISLLQDAVIADFISKLGKLNDSNKSLTFLVHGFRKPFKENVKDNTSTAEYIEIERSVMKHTTQSTGFIEIYWDACYDCCFGKDFSKNKQLFRLFETAQIHARKVGCSLRKVLTKIEADQINILSHSLGAMVVMQSLFNYRDCANETPSATKINICLLAPAIAGSDISKNYYSRVTAIDYRKNDNYRLAIAYNIHDFVLEKKIRKLGIKLGPGPYKYGNTTLGCNYDNDATDLKKYFNEHYSGSYLELIDLSDAGTCHYLGNDCYSRGDLMQRIVRFFEN